MKRSDKTSLGGAAEVFPTTHWSVILHADSLEKPALQEVIDQLIRDYWKPVYIYLRQKGYANERAKDLTQGFFHEVFLGRDLINRAHPEKGRFRTFVLTALDRFVIDVHRQEKAAKRSGTGKRLDFETLPMPDIPAEQSTVPPDHAFNYAWATSLLDQVMVRVRGDCMRDGKAKHWQVFEARVLSPILQDKEAPTMPELCKRFGIASEIQGSNMMVTIKRRFRAAVQGILRQQVEDDADVEVEIQDLIDILSQPCAI